MQKLFKIYHIRCPERVVMNFISVHSFCDNWKLEWHSGSLKIFIQTWSHGSDNDLNRYCSYSGNIHVVIWKEIVRVTLRKNVHLYVSLPLFVLRVVKYKGHAEIYVLVSTTKKNSEPNSRCTCTPLSHFISCAEFLVGYFIFSILVFSAVSSGIFFHCTIFCRTLSLALLFFNEQISSYKRALDMS